jgi:hypothetical protein
MRLAKDPQYSQWFLQVAEGPLYSYSGCQQMGEGFPPHAAVHRLLLEPGERE